MSVPYQPQNLVAQQSDGNIVLTWRASLGAVTYDLQRSLDGVNFTTIASPGVIPQYLDVLPGVGIMYWYQIAGVNVTGTGIYSSIVQMVAAPPSEMSLFELRLRSQETADRVGSQFVKDAECNSFLRLAMYELYDLLIDVHEDLFADKFVFINTNGSVNNYPLPNGYDNYLGGVFGSSTGIPSPAFYKLSGMDLGVNTSNNAWVTLKKYNFIDRNKYVYPNSTSTIYGVYNMSYRLMGNKVNIIPTPAGNQQIRMWYSPKLASLLLDTDLTTIGYSGWLRYPIVRAAKYMLDKEEGTDTSKLDAELMYLKDRITNTASDRDEGAPDTISETRRDGIYNFGWGGGSQGGW